MSIKEVAYYQARCDVCGGVDDTGEFTAWGDPDAARMNACESEWVEIEVPVSATVTGLAVYVVQREGQPAFNEQSILICREHRGDGIQWCATCEDDLDESAWSLEGDEIRQACSNQHISTVALLASEPVSKE